MSAWSTGQPGCCVVLSGLCGVLGVQRGVRYSSELSGSFGVLSVQRGVRYSSELWPISAVVFPTHIAASRRLLSCNASNV
jgi:hypothetical protein